jgi:hypothetical protein
MPQYYSHHSPIQPLLCSNTRRLLRRLDHIQARPLPKQPTAPLSPKIICKITITGQAPGPNHEPRTLINQSASSTATRTEAIAIVARKRGSYDPEDCEEQVEGDLNPGGPESREAHGACGEEEVG